MTNTIIAIDSEFQSLIPPLTDDEYQRLERSILAEGVREPIITWNGTIIDGHNRYHICDEHGIEFRTTEREFASRDAAKIWIIENQFGRRNLSTYDRATLALQLEPLIAAEAKRRSGERTDLRQKSDEGSFGRTDAQLAKLAGTSRDTIRKVKAIETEAAKGNETAIEAREAVKRGGKSIHKAFTEVMPKGDRTDTRRLCVVCGKPIDDGDSYDHDANKHKACAYALEKARKGVTRAAKKEARTEDGRRICTVCGKPIDDGDSYKDHPAMHKRCYNDRNSAGQYKKPDKSLLENVPTFTIDSLLMELQASAEDMRSAWEESISINEGMGVRLTRIQRKRLNRAVTNMFKQIESIRKEANNG